MHKVIQSSYLLKPSRLSLVSPGILSTSATLDPISLLNIVDLPTLGFPMSDIVKISSFKVSTVFTPLCFLSSYARDVVVVSTKVVLRFIVLFNCNGLLKTELHLRDNARVFVNI